MDCNNFFVSCERAFRPDLEKKPVVVLSNNDGCVISRSQEAKDLGIPMGMPHFKCRDELKKHGVTVFSSNFSLYGDLSDRVMNTLHYFSDDIQIYSIDEAFLQFEQSAGNEALAREIKKTVRQWTRIPVSVGIGPTKVLAKAANHIAKKNPQYQGVFDFTDKDINEYLKDFPVGQLWGIGRQHSQLLWRKNINTALEFKSQQDAWIKKHLGSNGLQIAYELRGISCFDLEKIPASKKGIVCSRSFGNAITSFEQLKEAIITHATRAAEKLRQEELVASYVYIFIRTNHFNTDKKYTASKGVELSPATSFTPLIIGKAVKLLETIYKDGFRYAKAGVGFSGLVREKAVQQNLFVRPNFEKANRLMKTIDTINKSFGHDTVAFLGAGIQKPWSAQKKFVSRRYTTSLEELPTAR